MTSCNNAPASLSTVSIHTRTTYMCPRYSSVGQSTIILKKIPELTKTSENFSTYLRINVEYSEPQGSL